MNNNLWRGRSLSFFLVAALSIVLWPAAETSALAQRRAAPRVAAAVTYECPMHPEVTSKKRGKCPKCGMMLVAKSKDTPRAATAGGAATTAKPAETGLNNLRIPDTAVVDQNGRKLNFYTDLVKGKTVIINFIFTTCTTICPPLTATFRRVQQDLGDHAGRDVQMISISVDPTVDVPERLKEFSAQFKAGPGWTFVTGSRPEIDGLLKALGAFFADKNDHTPMILIGNDAANYWTRSYGLSPASTLIKTIVEAAARSGDKTPSASGSAESNGTSQTGGATSAKPNSTAPASANYFPNLVLFTQDNRPVHFYDDLLKGKVVLINFIFTTCQGVCSPMTANLARVQNYLAEHLGKEVLMISISVDPLTDTPERLKKYADSFKVKPGWYFLTGEKKNIDWVLYKLGGYVEDKQQHSTVLIMGNEATGEWMKVVAMANPTEIANAVTKLLASKPE